MAHDLKLHIWKVLLKPTYGDKLLKNEELFRRIIIAEGDDKMDPYQALIKQFIQSFNGEFRKDKKGNKSFAPISGKIKVFSKKQLICGFFEGGVTGIKQTIKPNKSFKTEGKPVGEDDVVGLEYYFHFWIPTDTNYAYIMIQSYNDVNRGISGPFFEHFQDFLGKYTYGFRNREPKVPKPIKDAFLEESVIVGIDIIKSNTNPTERSRFNPSLQDAKKLQFKFGISGFKIEARNFLEYFKFSKKGNPFFIDLSEIGLEDPNDYITSVKYKDPITKRQTTAELTDILNVRPTILLPNAIKRNDSDAPDFDKIFDFCNNHLKLMQIEDNYGTIDEFKG